MRSRFLGNVGGHLGPKLLSMVTIEKVQLLAWISIRGFVLTPLRLFVFVILD